MNTLIQDIKYAVRVFTKSPGFTAIALLTLALGIGANTAIFSVVDGFLLRPLPVKDPGQITVLARQQKNEILSQYLSYPEYQDFRQQASSAFSDMLAYRVGLDGLSVNGHADHILTSFVTGNYFTMLGVKPFLGRLILPSEGGTAGADPVIVLGYDYWRTLFGSDPNVVGKSVSIDGHAFTVVGVAPESFHGLNAIVNMQAYMPMGMSTVEGDLQNNFMADRNQRSFIVFGRLKPGVSLEQAQTALNVIARRTAEEHPQDEKDLALSVFPELLARPVPLPHNPILAVSALFMGLAALVLLLACFNVANLLLVRATVRQREMAIRAALGGTRARLVRQLLTESLILAFLGGGAGILVGEWGSAMIGSVNFHSEVPLLLNFSFDWRVFLFALAAAALTGIIVGIVPALRASRSDLNEVLHEGGRTVSAAHHKLRSVLVVAEIAGSLVLLIVAALFTRSLQDAQKMNLGFDPHGVLNLTMDPNEVGYSEAQGREFYKQLLERARSLPGVESASVAFSVPMGENYTSKTINVPGYTPPSGQTAPTVANNLVSPGYFKTMRMPLVRGRVFTDADDKKSQRVAIVNQTMAARFWPHQDVIGMTFTADNPPTTYHIVGVVKNARYTSVFEQDEAYFYVPFAQDYVSLETLQARTPGDAGSMADELQKQVQKLAPGLPVFNVQTMGEALGSGQGFLVFRLGAALAGTLGLLGLVLVLVGVYGVVSYAARQRTHEIGIRMALGAQPRAIRKLIIRQGIILVISGLGVGFAAAFAASRVVGNFLVGVSAVDPVIWGSVAALLAAVTLTACYIPARRAMRVDPIVALRYE
ncbi:MAG: ABC transporter permease [Candidatus Acidiferrales bacterium]